MEGKGRHGNKLEGTSLQDRHKDLVRQMAAEMGKVWVLNALFLVRGVNVAFKMVIFC